MAGLILVAFATSKLLNLSKTFHRFPFSQVRCQYVTGSAYVISSYCLLSRCDKLGGNWNRKVILLTIMRGRPEAFVHYCFERRAFLAYGHQLNSV